MNKTAGIGEGTPPWLMPRDEGQGTLPLPRLRGQQSCLYCARGQRAVRRGRPRRQGRRDGRGVAVVVEVTEQGGGAATVNKAAGTADLSQP